MSPKFEFTPRDEGMKRPPAFTKCVDCGCCYAELYADNDPICWACDAGEPCKGKLRPQPSVPQPQPSPQPAPSVQEKPMRIKSTHDNATRISDEIRAAIIAADPSVKHAHLARKYGISDVSVFTIRKAAGIFLAKGPRSKPGPKPATPTVKTYSAEKVSAAKNFISAVSRHPQLLAGPTGRDMGYIPG